MDFVSHALWGGVALGRRSKKLFLIAAGISILPDLLTEGLFGVLYFFNIGGMPGWKNGHPNITDYPLYAQNLYNITHSLIIFAIIFGLLWLLFKKPIWIMAAWGLHILIDIPTHSLALFPTPFLWPMSDYKFDGIGWRSPYILGTDILLLLVTYFLWLRPKLSKKG